MTAVAFERDLVSIVTSLIHLRSIVEALKKKDFVTARMTSVMVSTAAEFQQLQAQFVRTEAALQDEAGPFLQQWLAAQGLSLGGELRLEGSMTTAATAWLRGRLDSIRLHPRQHGGGRFVELDVSEVGYAVASSGPFRPYESCALASIEPVVGKGWHVVRLPAPNCVRVVLPIKGADIRELATSAYRDRYRLV